MLRMTTLRPLPYSKLPPCAAASVFGRARARAGREKRPARASAHGLPRPRLLALGVCGFRADRRALQAGADTHAWPSRAHLLIDGHHRRLPSRRRWGRCENRIIGHDLQVAWRTAGGGRRTQGGAEGGARQQRLLAASPEKLLAGAALAHAIARARARARARPRSCAHAACPAPRNPAPRPTAAISVLPHDFGHFKTQRNHGRRQLSTTQHGRADCRKGRDYCDASEMARTNTACQPARCLEEEAGAVAPAAARRDGLVRRRCAGRAAVTASAAIVVVCCVLLLRPRSGAAICPRTASCAMPPPPCVSRRRLPPYHLTRRAVPCRPQSTGGRRPGCKGRRRRGPEVKPRSARPFATPRRADAGAQARLAVCFAHACASHTRRRADGHACGRARRDPRAQRD